MTAPPEIHPDGRPLGARPRAPRAILPHCLLPIAVLLGVILIPMAWMLFAAFRLLRARSPWL